MEGHKVRGRYPLTSLWLLAEMRGDITTKIKVDLAVEDTAAGMTQGVLRRYYERWLARYADGVVD